LKIGSRDGRWEMGVMAIASRCCCKEPTTTVIDNHGESK
jgi:hypothetical protein